MDLEAFRWLLTDDGQITDVVVDVGGFLGIGEKPVAMTLTDLDILQQDGGDERGRSWSSGGPRTSARHAA